MGLIHVDIQMLTMAYMGVVFVMWAVCNFIYT